MKKLLLPVDGSDASERGIAYVIENLKGAASAPELHLLNVQSPLPSGVTKFVNGEVVREYHIEEGEKELAAARAQLDAAGLKYLSSIEVGLPAEVIADYAREKKIDQIILGTRGLGAVTGMLLGSVTIKIIRASNTPVLLVK